MSSQKQWFRVYERGSHVGVAWASAGEASLVSYDCGTPGIQIRSGHPGGLWGELFSSGRPSFSGAAAWYQLWNRPTRSFLGWYQVGWRTAQNMARFCPSVDVFTAQGRYVF